MKIMIIVFVCVISILIIYGVIVTSILVVKIKTVNRFNNLFMNMQDELLHRREIITKQNEFLNKVKLAKTLKDHIKLQQELNKWSGE